MRVLPPPFLTRKRGKKGLGSVEELSGSTLVSFSERLHLLATKKLGRKKRGLKEVSVAGRCTIVDHNGDVLHDSFIHPNRHILSLRTFVSGITQRDMHG